MPSSLALLRTAAFHQQAGRCFYCRCQMWLGDKTAFVQRFNISIDQAACLQCTAEHLVARQDGGLDSEGNIVAACLWCNRKRHQRKKAKPSLCYRSEVQRRMCRRKWHQDWVFRSDIWTGSKL